MRMTILVPSDAMVTKYCGQYLVTAFYVLIIVECIICLELLELRVPVHVALGTRATLSCRWGLGRADVLYSVKWYKDGKEFFRYVPRDSEPRRKFPLPGVDVETSDASGSRLVLSAVASETAGRYRCEVSGEGPLFATVSEHADMNVVVLPDQGPIMMGLRTRYHLGDHVKANCTSGRSRPACELSWYINGELAPATAVSTPLHQLYGDKTETTTLLIEFQLTEQYFTKNTIKVKCLSTLASLYWRSNEESALLEKVKLHGRQILTKIHETDSRVDRIQTNIAWLISCSSITVVVALLLSYVMC